MMIFTGMAVLEILLVKNAISTMFGGTVNVKTSEEMAADLSYSDENAVEMRKDFEKKQIAKPPSATRRIGRMIGNKVGLRTRASLERERRERMPRALELYNQRREASEKVFHDALENIRLQPMVDSIGKGLNDFADAVAQNEKDKQDDNFINRMHDATQMTDYKKKQRRVDERVQESIEKDLNQRLTKISNLEEMATIGGLGITKSEIRYNSHPITVYNMQGAPLKMLTTSISYKDSAVAHLGEGAIGGLMMQRLEVMPALWLDNEQRVREENLVMKGRGANVFRGNTLSASYTDVFKNPDKRLGTDRERAILGKDEPYIVYGWEQVEPGSVLNVGDFDLNTPQNVVKDWMKLSVGDLGIWERLENSTGGGYNEVVMWRYKDNGAAKPPDYLVIENGQISDAIKHHAATFGVPIINVERKYYGGYGE